MAPASPILKYPNVSWGHTGIKDLLFTYLCHECVVNVGLVKVELLQLQRDSQNTRQRPDDVRVDLGAKTQTQIRQIGAPWLLRLRATHFERVRVRIVRAHIKILKFGIARFKQFSGNIEGELRDK